MSLMIYARAFSAITGREVLRFLSQRERFFSALVRPLVWLIVFANGFRSVLGISIIPPYETYITYDVYVAPGLIAMIQLFNGMQSSLSMVYDREMGSMRVLLTTPLPRWFLLVAKLFAGTAVSILQVWAFMAVAMVFNVDLSWMSFVTVLPALILSGMMLGALGMFLSSTIKQLENFAGVMNFVIFPTFFMSTALYPLYKVREGSVTLANIVQWNPFTYAVEAARFGLYGHYDLFSLGYVALALVVFLAGAVWGYNPTRGFQARKGGPAEG